METVIQLGAHMLVIILLAAPAPDKYEALHTLRMPVGIRFQQGANSSNQLSPSLPALGKLVSIQLSLESR